MFATKALIEDFQLQAMGGMAGNKDIWENTICLSLLNNCGSWVGVGKAAFKLLNELQNSYLRMVYSCPPSTPIPALRAQAGILDMEHKEALEKVCLVTTVLHTKEQESYTRGPGHLCQDGPSRRNKELSLQKRGEGSSDISSLESLER